MRLNTEADFWAKGQRDEHTGCIIWQGSKCKKGYGFYSLRQKTVKAHRYAWALANGLALDEIPKGQVVMHSCDNPSCFNPAHLSLGTQQENVADMHARGRGTKGPAVRTHCKRGHEFTPENTEIYGRDRKCRQCAYDVRRERQGVKRAPIEPGSRRHLYKSRLKAGDEQAAAGQSAQFSGRVPRLPYPMG